MLVSRVPAVAADEERKVQVDGEEWAGANKDNTKECKCKYSKRRPSPSPSPSRTSLYCLPCVRVRMIL